MKIASLQETLDQLATTRAGKKVVFTNGCFDLIHVGHLRYLNEARALGDLLVVGLNSDSSVKQLKGPSRPLLSEQERYEMLMNLKAIDHVILFSEETPIELIKAIQPEVLVKGGDYTIETIVGSDLVLAKGGEVKSLQFVDGYSTTNLIDKIKNI